MLVWEYIPGRFPRSKEAFRRLVGSLTAFGTSTEKKDTNTVITNSTIRAFLHPASVDLLKKGTQGAERILGMKIESPEMFPFVQIPGVSFQFGVPDELRGHVRLFSLKEAVRVKSYEGLRKNGTYAHENDPNTVVRVSEVSVENLTYTLMVQGPDLSDMAILADKVLAGEIRPSHDHCAEQIQPPPKPEGE